MRGSPHLNALIWTSDWAKLISDSKDAYVKFIDKHVQGNLPNEEDGPRVAQLVKIIKNITIQKPAEDTKTLVVALILANFL